jgi:hypothetical protein
MLPHFPIFDYDPSLKVKLIVAIPICILIHLNFLWLEHRRRKRVIEYLLALAALSLIFVIKHSFNQNNVGEVEFFSFLFLGCFWALSLHDSAPPPNPIPATREQQQDTQGQVKRR